jgi:hypothetical protein
MDRCTIASACKNMRSLESEPSDSCEANKLIMVVPNMDSVLPDMLKDTRLGHGRGVKSLDARYGRCTGSKGAVGVSNLGQGQRQGQGVKEMWSAFSSSRSSNREPFLASFLSPSREQSSSGTWALPIPFAQHGSLQFYRLVCRTKQPQITHTQNMAPRLAQSKLDLTQGMLQSSTLEDKQRAESSAVQRLAHMCQATPCKLGALHRIFEAWWCSGPVPIAPLGPLPAPQPFSSAVLLSRSPQPYFPILASFWQYQLTQKVPQCNCI